MELLGVRFNWRTCPSHLEKGCVNPDSSKSATTASVFADLSLNHTAL